jgi:hypothetical protein
MRIKLAGSMTALLVPIAMALSCGAGTPDDAPAPGAALLDSCAAALGGAVRLADLNVIHTVDSIQVAGLSGTTESWWVRNPFMGLSVTAAGPVRQEMLIIGDSVWTVDRNGHLSPGGADAESQLELSKMTVFYDYLMDPAMVEVGADTLIDSIPVVPLRLPGDQNVVIFCRKDSWLPYVMTATTMGLEILSYPDDYRNVQGIVTAMTTRSVVPAVGQQITSVNILTEYDVPVPESLFVLSSGAADWELTAQGVPYPFSLDLEHIFLEGEVEGRPALVLLDSGAGATVLDSSMAASLGLETSGSLPARGIGGAEEFSFAVVREYSAAGAVVRGQNLAVMPISEVFYPSTGHRIDLILGYDFLSRFIAEIDYGSGAISLFSPDSFDASSFSGAVIPAERSMSLLSVEAVLEDSITVRLLLDTGAGGNIHLTPAFFEEHPDFLSGRPVFQTAATGVGGEEAITGFRVSSISLGGYSVPGGLCSSFTGLDVFDAYDGILGAGVLCRFIVGLDYAGSRIFLAPSSLFHTGLQENLTGLGLEISGGFLVVGAVIAGSAGELAGILEGDTLLAVDGLRVGPDDLPGITGLMPAEPGDRTVLTVLREGVELDLAVTAARLVP